MTVMNESAALAPRVEALERHIRRLQDELDLYRLVATYAPAFDSGASEIVANLWTEDGIYDVDVGTWTGHQQITEMVEAAVQQGAAKMARAHVISMPHLRIDGDTAVATCHSRLYVKRGDGFDPWRVAANRWEFERTPDGWRIKRRINRLMDGTPEPRDLLRKGVETAVAPMPVDRP